MSDRMDDFLFFQDDDSEDYWAKLLQESDLNQNTITPQLKSKILEFKAQVNKVPFSFIDPTV